MTASPRAPAHAAPLLLLALVACGRDPSPSGAQAAPSSSVVVLGNALGACSVPAACADECDAGSADRCRRLAATYALGQAVPQDEARAAGLYARACAMSDGPSCMFSGQMHEFAHGVPKDDALAARDYERSCDLGWAAGCYNLAILYERGAGVPQDRVKAGDLYQVACTAGAKSACAKAREMHGPPAPPFLDAGLPW